MTRAHYTSAKALSNHANPHPVTVMVVDDETDLRESVCELLSTKGYDVICAGDGKVALEHLKNDVHKPDVILLDLMMPRMNGWQFREEQSKDPNLASIPVVVITATHDIRQIEADEVLYKPIKVDQLLDVVERWGGHDGPAAAAAPRPRTMTKPAKKVSRAGRAPAPRHAEADRGAPFSEKFVETLGHDLRNSLSAISMTGNLLSALAKSPEIAEPTARIPGAVDRMELTISHLLDFLRIRFGAGIHLEPRSINLADVYERLVRTTALCTGREINFAASGDADGAWDRNRMEVLLSTLITDACDRDRSDNTIDVTLDASSPDRVRLEVTHRGTTPVDLGPEGSGPQDDTDPETIEAECLRLGVGLYIAREIVHAHGGHIRVESGEAPGTRFTVELPRDTARA